MKQLHALILSTSLWVALGSGLGSMSRYGLQLWLPASEGALPLATLTVNVLGSFLIGLIAAIQLPSRHLMASVQARQFLMTGFCGGFTTFSVFSLETLRLLEANAWPMAALNIGSTLLLCLAGVAMGYGLAKSASTHVRTH
ncbi:MAG: fluoride efflux transporter CrcB [Marinobacter sp.]|nr:fluoride efflux transporter CrcB [Marinobacter sp.]